jgi:hypothetical protein
MNRTKTKTARRANVSRMQIARAKGRSNMTLAEIVARFGVYSSRLSQSFSFDIECFDPLIESMERLGDSAKDLGRQLQEISDKTTYDLAIMRTEPFAQRGMMIVEGNSMLGADFSQIEARVAAFHGLPDHMVDPDHGGTIVDSPDGPENNPHFEFNFGDTTPYEKD